MSNNAHDLTNRLLNALDSNYNVVDMQAVNEIICILEKINITKELLEYWADLKHKSKSRLAKRRRDALGTGGGPSRQADLSVIDQKVLDIIGEQAVVGDIEHRVPLFTTRLGKHVNELRRRTTDAALARRAKVLVKRWRDLVIPSVASPNNNNAGSNRSSAERQVRRLGGTPLTSPALSRLVVSPAVSSPRLTSRPAWGGYESDSQDVILVDDDPSPVPLPGPVPLSPAKRSPSPELVHDDKKAKRDKKPKKRRGHSRAGSEAASWRARNGDARRNGCQLPTGNKVKTTQELLEEIQSRGLKAASPAPAPPSPDLMLIEPEVEVKPASPLRNGGSPHPSDSDSSPEPELGVCSCDSEPLAACTLGAPRDVPEWHVTALHRALLPGINGTRAPVHPAPHHARPVEDPDRPGLFASVVPLYKHQDYADDYCLKNVDVCEHKRETQSASTSDSLVELCARALDAVPYRYSAAAPAPVGSLRRGSKALLAALEAPAGARDHMGRPARAPRFAEWHEPARLPGLLALPYVLID